MKVICINNTQKPSKIPQNEWITEGSLYTVISVAPMGIQAGKFGYKLKEISLSPSSFPYEYYSADRFGVLTDQSLKAETSTEEIVEEELTI